MFVVSNHPACVAITLNHSGGLTGELLTLRDHIFRLWPPQKRVWLLVLIRGSFLWPWQTEQSVFYNDQTSKHIKVSQTEKLRFSLNFISNLIRYDFENKKCGCVVTTIGFTPLHRDWFKEAFGQHEHPFRVLCPTYIHFCTSIHTVHFSFRVLNFPLSSKIGKQLYMHSILHSTV